MAEITELENKRAAERRLALLALTGEQQDPGGSCLDDDELAALVEERLTPEQAGLCLAHLAACEHCYALWRQLDQERQHEARKGGPRGLLRLIGQPRFLAATGSILAAAASVAVFLTLTTQVDRTTLTRLPEQSIQEQPLPQTVPEPRANSKAAPAPLLKDRASQAARQTDAVPPSPEPGKSKERVERSASTDHGATMPAPPREKKAPMARQDDKDWPAPAAPGALFTEAETATDRREKTSAAEAAKAAGKAEAPAPQATATGTAAPLTLEDWRRSIRQGCEGRPGPGFFAVIARQGRQLLRESAAVNTQDRRQIERLLAVLATERPAAHQCPALLDILGPAAQGQER